MKARNVRRDSQYRRESFYRLAVLTTRQVRRPHHAHAFGEAMVCLNSVGSVKAMVFSVL